jgi:hypothetical protein
MRLLCPRVVVHDEDREWNATRCKPLSHVHNLVTRPVPHFRLPEPSHCVWEHRGVSRGVDVAVQNVSKRTIVILPACCHPKVDA